jgi:hypothetical protein
MVELEVGEEVGEEAAHEFTPEIRVGVLVAPGLTGSFVERLVEDVTAALQERHPGIRWRLETVEDGLVEPPAEDVAIVTAARERLLGRTWDLVLCLTDLPLRVARRPVVAHASPLHGVAVLSVPALGPVGLRRRARDAVLRLIDALLGEGETADPGHAEAKAPSRRLTRRLRELGSDTDDDGEGIRFTARVLTGHLRLLIGMVRANRPWRLAARLSRAVAAAGAAGALALVTSDIWRLADALGWLRLGAVAVGAAGAITAALILGAGLWEHVKNPAMRQQVVLFNLATTGTVLVGVVALYVALSVVALPVALVLIPDGLFASALGHPAHFRNYLELAWLTSSLATFGGALGAGLETDEAILAAAYTYRTSAATERDAGPAAPE